MKNECWKYWLKYLGYIAAVIVTTLILSSMGYDNSTWQRWAIIGCCVICEINGYLIGLTDGELIGLSIGKEVSKK